jgi:competence protein ComEA
MLFREKIMTRLSSTTLLAAILFVLLPSMAFAASPHENLSSLKSSPAKGLQSEDVTGSIASSTTNLNTASESEIASLPLIGNARAQAVIAARPFHSTSELLSRGIVSKRAFNAIKNQITVR